MPSKMRPKCVFKYTTPSVTICSASKVNPIRYQPPQCLKICKIMKPQFPQTATQPHNGQSYQISATTMSETQPQLSTSTQAATQPECLKPPQCLKICKIMKPQFPQTATQPQFPQTATQPECLK